jgi:DNA-binding MarR family transcriptional regulator
MSNGARFTESVLKPFRRSLERIVNAYVRLERRPLDFGTGELLHPSEIHLIEAIGDNPNPTVTTLAAAFGITKGAVSQTVSKLEEKGYISRHQGRNDKEVLLLLTARGKVAEDKHAALHREMDRRMASLFARTSPEELEILRRNLDLLGEVVEGWDRELEARGSGAAR